MVVRFRSLCVWRGFRNPLQINSGEMSKTGRRSPLWDPLLALGNVADGHYGDTSCGDVASMREIFVNKSWRALTWLRDFPLLYGSQEFISLLTPVKHWTLSWTSLLHCLCHIMFFLRSFIVSFLYIYISGVKFQTTFLACLSACCMYGLSLLRLDHPITSSWIFSVIGNWNHGGSREIFLFSKTSIWASVPVQPQLDAGGKAAGAWS